VELATLLSVKTGGCPEDCGYCPQSVHIDTGVEAGKLMDVATGARRGASRQAAGATRFCMGAAWRAPKDRDIEKPWPNWCAWSRPKVWRPAAPWAC
jgi:biotin synthase